MYDNLEIFILSYNRSSMLAQSLKSICDQSADGFSITILDNASTDNTEEIVEDIKTCYPNRDITFITAETNLGNLWNYQRAKQLAKKEWVMIFHDDDILHPEYIKNAMDLLSQNPEAVMVSCTYTPIEYPDDKNWEIFSNDAYIADVKDFAALMFGFLMHNFGSTIYKTELFKTNDGNLELYGKIFDRPLMLDIAKHGKTVILKAPYVRYRVHPGQDTNAVSTGPFENEYFALMNCYKKVLGNSWFDKYGIIYNSFIHTQLKLGYRWLKCDTSNKTFKAFKQRAALSGVLRNFEVPKIVEKLYKFSGFICKKIMYK